MNKGTNLISEIGKYFKENNATNTVGCGDIDGEFKVEIDRFKCAKRRIEIIEQKIWIKTRKIFGCK